MQSFNSNQNLKKHPLFLDKYLITEQIGQGNTSKVYLGIAKDETIQPQQVAIKILKQDFIQRSDDNLQSFRNEIQILRSLNQPNIVKLVDYGDAGLIIKPSGRKLENLIYLMMEHVQGRLLFDVCKSNGSMGEDVGRLFAIQMLNCMEFMQQSRVAHRDLKLENIILTNSGDVKLVDFGFACQKQIDNLKSYRGTFTYMAPEIKEGKNYGGTQVDIFSFGVILFVVTHGIFPFKEARQNEYFYNLLMTGQHTLYFNKVNGGNLSADFKDLMISVLSHEPEKRPSLNQIRNHPWIQKSFNQDLARNKIIGHIQQTIVSKPESNSQHASGAQSSRK